MNSRHPVLVQMWQGEPGPGADVAHRRPAMMSTSRTKLATAGAVGEAVSAGGAGVAAGSCAWDICDRRRGVCFD